MAPIQSSSNPSAASSSSEQNSNNASTSSATITSQNNHDIQNPISSGTSTNKTQKTHLDLSINPIDGTLLTAPLSLIINNATDTLYNDLHSMTNDVLTLTIPSAKSKTSVKFLEGGSAGHSHGVATTAMSDDNTATNDTNNKDYNTSMGVMGMNKTNDPHHNSRNSNNNNDYTRQHTSLTSFTTKQETMSNMSFQQRRHILASTLAKHIKSISHVSALLASNLFTSGSESINTNHPNNYHDSKSSSSTTSKTTNATVTTKPNLFTLSQTPNENELSSITITTSKALNHIRTSWVNADEAQDALYFHHDTLWKVRSHPHDVKGALDVVMKGQWVDLSKDICLKDVDGTISGGGYDESEEGKWDIHETRERLKCVVRRKLMLGEVGMFHSSLSLSLTDTLSSSSAVAVERKSNTKNIHSFWWNNMVLEQNGVVLRLFHGRPFKITNSNNKNKNNKVRQSNKNVIYPIEARVTVLTEQKYPNNNHDKNSTSHQIIHPSPWTLLSMRLHTNVKTGESNHQLELSQEQMYRFHKLCEIAMSQEENRANQLNSKQCNDNDDHENTFDDTNGIKKTIVIARPLEKLLDMCHVFSLSWQLEILSSQADALRKGTWKSYKTDGNGGGITVSHVHFFDDNNNNQNSDNNRNNMGIDGMHHPIAVMAIHFWEVDDRNGRPSIEKLTTLIENESDEVSNKSYLPSSDKNHDKRLTLEIIAVPRVGLEVSLSGGKSVMKSLQSLSRENANKKDSYLQRNVDKLFTSIQNPFQLSASDALLAAAVICAEHRCHAAVKALLRLGNKNQNTSLSSLHGSRGCLKALPSWLHLSVECGSIVVAASISYNGKKDKARLPVLLFRLACDSRTGCFIPTFPHSATLLRQLVCNDLNASDVQRLRQARVSSNQHSASSSNKRTSAADRSGKELTGRLIKDAFETLTRSLDVLGRRVGVGGDWDDVDTNTSSLLREKSIMQSCDDVRSSLMNCSGIAAIYCIAATAVGLASGLSPQIDIAGGPIVSETDNRDVSMYLPIPPLAVIMNQQMVEEEVVNTDGENSIVVKLERDLCGMVSSVSQESLTLHLFDISASMTSVTELALRKRCEIMPMELGVDDNIEDLFSEGRPTKRIRHDEHYCEELQEMTKEVGYLMDRLNATWDHYYFL